MRTNLSAWRCGVWLLLFCCCLESANALVLENAMRSVDLASHLELLEDAEGLLNHLDIQSPDIAARFVPWTEGGAINLGFTASTYWFRFTLQASSDVPRPWMLEIPYLHLNQVDFYAPGKNVVQTGHERPIESRAYFHRFFVFPIELSAAPQVFYLRVRSSYALSLPALLSENRTFVYQAEISSFFQALYYGGMFALLVYNLALSVFLRDRRFLFYSFFAAFLGLGIFAGNGLGRLFLWSEWLAFDAIAQSTLICLGAVFGLKLSCSFLQTRSAFPKSHRFLLFSMGVFALLAAAFLLTLVLPLPVMWLTEAMMLITLPVGALILILSFRALLRGAKGVRFFALSWVCLWTGACVATFRAFGLLPTNTFTAYAVQIASAFEIFMLSLALADLVREERQARDAAQQEASASRIALLDQIERTNRELESQVRERTEQLEIALQHEKLLVDKHMYFSALVSHEFLNPLAIIQTQVSLVRRERELNPNVDFKKRIDAIGCAANRLVGLFSTWRTGDQIRRSLSQANREPLDLVPWLHAVLFENGASVLEGRLILDLSAGPLNVLADRGLLETALMNLLDNARKYSPKESIIQVELRRKPGFSGVAVIDQGIGIAPGDFEAIFKDYFRVKSEGIVHGLGLGLSLVQRIADLHGGSVELESTLGQGSTFCLWISNVPDAEIVEVPL